MTTETFIKANSEEEAIWKFNKRKNANIIKIECCDSQIIER